MSVKGQDQAGPQHALVVPQVLKGFQDLLPEDAIARDYTIDAIKRVFEKFGFLPIDTPAMEYLVTLIGTGGEDMNKALFRLQSPEHEAIALRFDLTVPFARLLAQYPNELRLPFRRYHIGPVWRADKPGPGRFRQFTQFDFDAAGSDSPAVDAEIVAAMCEVMAALGVSAYVIHINNRRLVDSVLAHCGIQNWNQQKHVLRVVDKLQKVGHEAVRQELGKGRVDESGDPIPGVGLDDAAIEQIDQFISLAGGSRAEVIVACRRVLPDTSDARSAVAEMEELAEALTALQVEERHVHFTPSLARGLDYYTGPVFETVLTAAPQFGSIMGGGRYDQLVGRFLPKRIPASGASIGMERLLAALKHIGAVRLPKTTTQVLVLAMPNVAMGEYLAIAAQLRGHGVCTEVYLGDPADGVKTQLSHANAKGIPLAVLLGEDELKAQQVSVKDLRVGMEERAGITDRATYRAAGRAGQQAVPRADLVQTIRQLLA